MLDIAGYYVDTYLPRPILSYVTPRNELRTVPTKSLSISAIGKQARMKSKPGSSKRQDRNFEIVVNHITTNEDQLPQVSRQSMAALQDVLGHNVKKYSGTFHKPGNEHVHFLVMSKAPNTKSAVKARIGASMALIFGTEAGSVDVKLFNESKADAGPAHSLKGLSDYRSLYVNNNDHENHRPKDPEHRTVEFMCSGDLGDLTWKCQEWFWTTRASASGNSGHQSRDS